MSFLFCTKAHEHAIEQNDHCSLIMPESHERILRRIIRRFGSFPTRTYSNRISNDADVRITYEERAGRVLNLNKTCT